jgi:hypothetical protein
MAKFMCTHTIPPGKFSADQLKQFAQAAQQYPAVKGYRSFANVAEGKAICVMEAATKDAVASWFAKMGMPFDNIIQVELEGDRGNIRAARQSRAALASVPESSASVCASTRTPRPICSGDENSSGRWL